mgnify:CR=1 FL=1
MSSSKASPVSPLAPLHVPELPPIRGVRLATAEAGIRYAGRTDVMLARLAPGTTLAAAFTRSSTRAACVLDCQAKLAAAGLAQAGGVLAVVEHQVLQEVAEHQQQADVPHRSARRRRQHRPLQRVVPRASAGPDTRRS